MKESKLKKYEEKKLEQKEAECYFKLSVNYRMKRVYVFTVVSLIMTVVITTFYYFINQSGNPFLPFILGGLFLFLTIMSTIFSRLSCYRGYSVENNIYTRCLFYIISYDAKANRIMEQYISNERKIND